MSLSAGLPTSVPTAPESGYLFPRVMSGGGGFCDFDRDGRLDIILLETRREPLKPERGTARTMAVSTCRVLRQTGPMRFSDISAQLGLETFPGHAMGLAVGDANNDGFPDLYITQHGGDRFLINDRGTGFRDVTEDAGIRNERWGASACFLDYDRDGRLDLYVTNYVDYDPAHRCLAANGTEDFCGPQVFNGTPDVLWRNITEPSTGETGMVALPRFVDATGSAGISDRPGPGLGVASADIDDDGWVDLFVANDGAANVLWINQRDGTFQDEAVLRGCAYDPMGRGRAGMGIALGDVLGTAALDLFVTHLNGESSGLFVADDQGSFQDLARNADLTDASLPTTGFGCAFLDWEHDGDLDLAVVNGHVRRPIGDPGSSAGGPGEEFWRPYAERNQLYVNTGSGRFQVLLDDEQPFAAPISVSRGLSMGDVDGDGDIDLLVTRCEAPPLLFRNDAAKVGGWLKIRAVEPELGGRDAYGARLTLRTPDRDWHGQISAGGSYLSAHDPVWHVGLGAARSVLEIAVSWPDGTREIFPGGEVNMERVLRHGEGRTP